MSKLHPLVQASLWNNEGARLLLLGDLENAVARIHCAARIVDGMAPGPCACPQIAKGCCDSKEQQPKCHDYEFLPADLAAQLHVDPMDPSREQDHSRHFLQDLQSMDGSVSVYQQPIFFSTHMTMASLDGDVSVEKLVRGAILFNLALISHMLAIVESEDSEEGLDHALEMYECSLGMVYVDAPGGTDNLAANAAIWQCLILNNMAHVLHTLCKYTESTDCLHEALVRANAALNEKFGKDCLDAV
jgi:hypothetical protein